MLAAILALAEPAPPLDQLPMEIRQMRDRPAERGQAKPQESGEDLPDRAWARDAVL